MSRTHKHKHLIQEVHFGMNTKGEKMVALHRWKSKIFQWRRLCSCVARQGFEALDWAMAIRMELERPWEEIGFPKMRWAWAWWGEHFHSVLIKHRHLSLLVCVFDFAHYVRSLLDWQKGVAGAQDYTSARNPSGLWGGKADHTPQQRKPTGGWP